MTKSQTKQALQGVFKTREVELSSGTKYFATSKGGLIIIGMNREEYKDMKNVQRIKRKEANNA